MNQLIPDAVSACFNSNLSRFTYYFLPTLRAMRNIPLILPITQHNSLPYKQQFCFARDVGSWSSLLHAIPLHPQLPGMTEGNIVREDLRIV